jgi:hypothetical protein
MQTYGPSNPPVLWSWWSHFKLLSDGAKVENMLQSTRQIACMLNYSTPKHYQQILPNLLDTTAALTLETHSRWRQVMQLLIVFLVIWIKILALVNQTVVQIAVN